MTPLTTRPASTSRQGITRTATVMPPPPRTGPRQHRARAARRHRHCAADRAERDPRCAADRSPRSPHRAAERSSTAESCNTWKDLGHVEGARIQGLVREFFTRNGVGSALLVLAFLFFYKLGDNMAVALQTPFFLDVGFSRTQIGTIAKFSILASTIVASTIGGLIMLKLAINRALWVFGLVQLTTSLGFAALAAVGPNPYMLAAAAAWEYFGVGLGTVALLAFIAQQTDRRFTATQLALLTSLMVVPRTFAGSITGYIIEAVGYFNFFLICTAVGVPGVLLLLKVAPWSGNPADNAGVANGVPQSSQS